MFPRPTLFSCPIRSVALALAAAASAGAAEPAPPGAPTTLAAVTVTGTREKALLRETPASIAAIEAESIRITAPLHPGQLLGQVPGVAVAVTNGEGHTTAIRQPFTTSPVYLFLEDGVPVRATGFFNHNALYEVNLPMAAGVEVIRGPGTALHGSDAIGGIVNILSRAPSHERHGALNAEVGAFGTWRLLGSGAGALSEAGTVRVDLNRTHTDGWRRGTAYDRYSGNLRFDQRVGRNGMVKAIAGVTRVDQQTGANSALPLDDYLHDPTRNNLAIAYRKVNAARISVEYEQQFGTGMVSLIPYFRDNAMELNATFNLNSDPRIDRTKNRSYGLLTKWRSNFPVMRARLIGGVDIDVSPGTHREDNILVTRTGSGANTVFHGYSPGTRIYDYDVTFRSASPYLHAEFSPFARMRMTAGLRHDALRYDMENRLPAGTVSASVLGATRYYGQRPDDRTRFARTSPKLGVTYALGRGAHLYGSYNYGFRAPSEGQLYRAGSEANPTAALARAQLALGLKPIEASQAELGLRGEFGAISGHLVVYDLEKRNDLVSQRDLATNLSTSVNAGRTEHQGIELGLAAHLGSRLRLDAALSRARHRYVDWVSGGTRFSGNDIEAAPDVLVNTRLTWRPVNATTLQFEWVRIGSYWLEAGNSPTFGKYPGHDLLNVRVSHAVSRRLGLFARLMNAADRRFAESASVSSKTPVFSPGLPRALYGGLDVHW